MQRRNRKESQRRQQRDFVGRASPAKTATRAVPYNRRKRKYENCPGWWLSVLIFRRLSETAIGGNKNGRYEQIGGTTQRALRARDSGLGEATRRKVGCERSRSGGGRSWSCWGRNRRRRGSGAG